jgi:murein DD-endopeptidase
MTLRAHQPTGIRIGGRSRRPPILPILLALSLAANAWFLLRWSPTATDADPSLADATLDAAEALAEPGAVVADPAASPSAATPAPAGATDSAEVVDAAVVEEPAPGAQRGGHVIIDGAVSRGFVKALGAEGERVAITASRLLVWNLDLTKDPRKGDTSDVLYRLSETGESDITIDAVRYKSQKFGKTFEAYRYKPAGWAFHGWFDADGGEVAGRLKGGPITDYAEITSLIGDGRGHAGMDFKAPVGSAVTAPFDGTITRINWNWKYNGNCVEMRRTDGSLIRFLHLSEVAEGIVAGTKVKPGQRIASSGNTGRSSAPHLHYELKSSGGRTLDPIKVHGIMRRSVPAGSKTEFSAHVTALRAKWAAPEAG